MKKYKCYDCSNRVEAAVSPDYIIWGCKLRHNRNVMSVENGKYGEFSTYAPFWCDLLNDEEKELINKQYISMGEKPVFEENNLK